MAYQNDSDDDGFMCFGCLGNPFKCGCADTSLRGNIPLPVPVVEIKPPVLAPLQVATMGPLKCSPVRRGAVKCHDEESDSESEEEEEEEDEGLTQPYYPTNQGVAAIEEPDTEEEPMAYEPRSLLRPPPRSSLRPLPRSLLRPLPRSLLRPPPSGRQLLHPLRLP